LTGNAGAEVLASRWVFNWSAVRVFRYGAVVFGFRVRVAGLTVILGFAKRLFFFVSSIAHDVPPVAFRAVSDDAIPPQTGEGSQGQLRPAAVNALDGDLIGLLQGLHLL
jgi:hypothetical protein